MLRSEILSSLRRITGTVGRRTAPRAGGSILPLATTRINGLSAIRPVRHPALPESDPYRRIARPATLREGVDRPDPFP